MPKILEKIKSFFTGQYICKIKQKPAQTKCEQEPKPQQEEQLKTDQPPAEGEARHGRQVEKTEEKLEE